MDESFNFEEFVQEIAGSFEESELPRFLLLELRSRDVRVSLQRLCDIAKTRLPSCDDLDVRPIVRASLSFLRRSAALLLERKKNPEHLLPRLSEDGEYVYWARDKEYLMDLIRHSGSAPRHTGTPSNCVEKKA